MPAPELSLQIPGFTLAAKVWGRPDAPKVLCLHGWLDNAASFDELAPLMTDHCVVALDLPGHGRSHHVAPGGLYAFIDLVGAVSHALQALGWERFSLMGHSLGAAIASVLAGVWAPAVDRLVLLEGLGPMVEDPKHAPERLSRALREERTKLGRPAPVYPDLDHVVELLCRAVPGLERTGAAILARRGLRAVDGGMTWRADPRLRFASRLRLTEEQVLAFMAAIACPTLLVRAEQGFPFATHLAQGRRAAIADLEVRTVPGGHHVHLDNAALVGPIVVSFLTGSASVGPSGSS